MVITRGGDCHRVNLSRRCLEPASAAKAWPTPQNQSCGTASKAPHVPKLLNLDNHKDLNMSYSLNS